MHMVHKNEHQVDSLEQRPKRRAGLIQRLGYTAGFMDRPRGEVGYSRREKIILGAAGLVIAAASIVGIKAAGDRVNEHYPHSTPTEVDDSHTSG